MAATVNWYDTDDTTLLTTLALGAIPPGQDYFTRNGSYVEMRVLNDGTEALASVDVEVQQAGTYDGYEYVRVATGGETPGTFQAYAANPLALGALAVDAAVSVWIDVIVPSDAAAEAGQAANLVLLGSV